MKALNTPRRLIGVVLATGISLLSGCGSWMPEMVPFGAVSAPAHNRSLNGLGVHRKMWESAGAKCLTPQKLSPKLETFDVIVFVGRSFDPPGKLARDWVEDWLADEPGRTVVYFGRDFNADIYYRQKTIDLLPAEKQPRAEQILAMRQARELNLRLREIPESTFCRWFYLDAGKPLVEHTQFQGDWADDLDGEPGTWPVGIALEPPAATWKSKKPSWLTTQQAVNPLKSASPPVVEEDPESGVTRSDWQPTELGTDKKWNAEFRKMSQSEILLASASGQALVFRLTNRRFEDSQILIVANGAPLLNGSLVEPLHQRVGEKLIEQCLPAKRVALLAYDDNGLLISQAPEKDSRGAGLEMLTVWPLSAITMPAALLGIIVCAVLLPILGRAQPLPQRNTSDFGLHVEALGRMLLESRDVAYAKATIETYYRRVRGEAPPQWLDNLETPRPAPGVGRPPIPTGANPSSAPRNGPPGPTDFKTPPEPPPIQSST